MNQPIKKNHILLVEDDEALSMLTLMFLEQQDIETVHAKNGDEALFEIAKQNYNVIITDLVMPQKDGLAFITELRKLGNTTPVIVTSGITDDLIHDQLYELGIEKIYTKPLLPEVYRELIEHVKQFL
jgi:DNA-binding response OmpR family regulator